VDWIRLKALLGTILLFNSRRHPQPVPAGAGKTILPGTRGGGGTLAQSWPSRSFAAAGLGKTFPGAQRRRGDLGVSSGPPRVLQGLCRGKREASQKSYAKGTCFPVADLARPLGK
jgi:hypothetical protein